MARNTVQFQKGLSEPEFERQFGTEEQCRAAIVSSRWPDGFVCPECGGRQHSLAKSRDLFRCSACRRQTSPIAGTIFAATKLPLRTWFRAIYHMTQTKQGISSIELGRRLGVRQSTAWQVKHRLTPCFSTHQNKPRVMSLLRHLDGSCGTTIASCGVQTMSFWTPPGDASIPGAS